MQLNFDTYSINSRYKIIKNIYSRLANPLYDIQIPDAHHKETVLQTIVYCLNNHVNHITVHLDGIHIEPVLTTAQACYY